MVWYESRTTESSHKKVAFAKVVEEPTTSLSTSASSAVSMAMDIDEVALKVDLPLPCLQGIWQKAENLLSSSKYSSSPWASF